MSSHAQTPKRPLRLHPLSKHERKLSELVELSDALFCQGVKELSTTVRGKALVACPFLSTFEPERTERRSRTALVRNGHFSSVLRFSVTNILGEVTGRVA